MTDDAFVPDRPSRTAFDRWQPLGSPSTPTCHLQRHLDNVLAAWQCRSRTAPLDRVRHTHPCQSTHAAISTVPTTALPPYVCTCGAFSFLSPHAQGSRTSFRWQYCRSRSGTRHRAARGVATNTHFNSSTHLTNICQAFLATFFNTAATCHHQWGDSAAKPPRPIDFQSLPAQPSSLQRRPCGRRRKRRHTSGPRPAAKTRP